MKRFLSAFLIFAMLLIPATALAEFDYDSIPTPNIIVVDGNDTNVVFYERDADQKTYPASTTKIMTAILALENGNLDDEFMVGEEVLGTIIKFTAYSSLMGIQPGETLTLRDLVYGLMLASGNDAAEAIAVHIGGSISGFVSMMNQKAAELGMTGTHFTNPHGIQNDEHYTTARDMTKLFAYALQNETFVKIAETTSYTVPANSVRATALELKNTDLLLHEAADATVSTVYQYAIAGKTGDTDAAGKCLVAAAQRDGARVIVALFGDKPDLYNGDTDLTKIARFLNARSIFDHVFETAYQTATSDELGLQRTFSTGVVNADEADLVDGQLTMTALLNDIAVRALPDRVASIKANAGSITVSVVLTTAAEAPIIAGQSMGTVEYKIGGDIICTAPLTADFAVNKVLEVSSVQTDEPAAVTSSPDSTPLIDKGRKDWTTGDTLTLTFVLLIVLLIALIIIFIISERKRRYERKRRARAKKRRQQYYDS